MRCFFAQKFHNTQSTFHLPMRFPRAYRSVASEPAEGKSLSVLVHLKNYGPWSMVHGLLPTSNYAKHSPHHRPHPNDPKVFQNPLVALLLTLHV
jgi:hypothetical protein